MVCKTVYSFQSKGVLLRLLFLDVMNTLAERYYDSYGKPSVFSGW